MAEDQDGKRTRKGELARQRLLETALRLFSAKGYEQITMRDIAAEAGYSPGLTYRYFTSKEELVILLYQRLAQDTDSYVSGLPPAPLTERFYMTITQLLALMTPHRQTLAALFGTALNPRSQAGVFGENTADIRRQTRGSYLLVVQGATDAPRTSQHEDLATVLYGLHLALVLFWLIDQSTGATRTLQLLAFLRDMLKLIQPILWLPIVSQALVRLAGIIGPLLGAEEQLVPSDVQKEEI